VRKTAKRNYEKDHQQGHVSDLRHFTFNKSERKGVTQTRGCLGLGSLDTRLPRARLVDFMMGPLSFLVEYQIPSDLDSSLLVRSGHDHVDRYFL